MKKLNNFMSDSKYDLLFFAGLALTAYGIAQINWPVALIYTGASMSAFSIYSART
jgi:hypothetical protein